MDEARRHELQQTNPDLLMRIRGEGNEDAWSEFDALYRPMLRRFAKMRGLGDADVEDVVQHCMAAVYMNIDGFQYDSRKGRFKSWLRTLVNNRCRDLVRRRHGTAVEIETLNEVSTTNDSPEHAFHRIWLDEHLSHCLRQLSREEEERVYSAFQRYVLDEAPVEQVCRDLGLTPNQLYKIKHRLTQRLRQMMALLVEDGLEFSLRP
jgi:RNA polymerase sigma-70 factor (ECF subfamily)